MPEIILDLLALSSKSQIFEGVQFFSVNNISICKIHQSWQRGSTKWYSEHNSTKNIIFNAIKKHLVILSNACINKITCTYRVQENWIILIEPVNNHHPYYAIILTDFSGGWKTGALLYLYIFWIPWWHTNTYIDRLTNWMHIRNGWHSWWGKAVNIVSIHWYTHLAWQDRTRHLHLPGNWHSGNTYKRH